MSKLFEVKPETRELVLQIETYKKNRIANKLLRLLKVGGVYKVSETKSKNPDTKLFNISVLSSEPRIETLEALKNEIISYIPDHFPINYFFDFKSQPLGFVSSFIVSLEGSSFVVSHKIKEMRSNGNTIIPKGEQINA